MKINKIAIMYLSLILGCNYENVPQSSSGVKKVDVKVSTNENGRTVEQENVVRRLTEDNTPGSIKHLYIFSAFSGKILIYSTVKGKVTSSGKRLTPLSVVDSCMDTPHSGMRISLGGNEYYTTEVIQDDGSYGSSVEYLYWWDMQDNYHQHYVSGGQIVHITSQPFAIPENDITIRIAPQH